MGQIYAVSKERMKKIRSLCGDKIFSLHIAEGRSDCEKSKREYNQSEVERAAELETDFMVHLTHIDDHDKELLCKEKNSYCLLSKDKPDPGRWLSRNWMHLQGLGSHGDLEAII